MSVSLRCWTLRLSFTRVSVTAGNGRLYLGKSHFSTANNEENINGSCVSKITLDRGILAKSEPKTAKQLASLTTRYPDFATWYACGPTVYDSSHIGHASSYIRLDIIRRILESQGITVLQVMGITDIDDKIIARSNQLNIPWTELGRKYELEFFNDLLSLNIKLPHIKARVSDFIPNIIKFVSELIDSGLAYPASDGSVYFDTEKYGAYNKFRLADAEDPPEEELNSDKRSRKDFAVWKGQKPGEPYWETKWGRGRPGWHIECSVMASHFFGPTLDIHSGGQDLIFPHHENEEAQCCAKYGLPQWVTHWIHTGHLFMRSDVKMSKSLGNTITIQDFLKENSPATLRMMCMLSQYNNTIEYSEEAKKHASSVLKKLESFIGNCGSLLSGQITAQQVPGSQSVIMGKLGSCKTDVKRSLITNFNVPKAIGTVQDLVSEFYQNVEIMPNPSAPVDAHLVFACKQFVEEFLELMGLRQIATETSQSEVLLKDVLTELLHFRKSVRTYSLALNETDKSTRKQKLKERQELMTICDDIRDRLKTLGVEVKDSGQDSSWTLRRGFG